MYNNLTKVLMMWSNPNNFEVVCWSGCSYCFCASYFGSCLYWGLTWPIKVYLIFLEATVVVIIVVDDVVLIVVLVVAVIIQTQKIEQLDLFPGSKWAEKLHQYFSIFYFRTKITLCSFLFKLTTLRVPYFNV